jgi:hypothetical protein
MFYNIAHSRCQNTLCQFCYKIITDDTDKQARVLGVGKCFQSSIMFSNMCGAYQSETLLRREPKPLDKVIMDKLCSLFGQSVSDEDENVS